MFWCYIWNAECLILKHGMSFMIVGWASAELVMTRLLPLWVGARGVEFDWKYLQMSFDANISLVREL